MQDFFQHIINGINLGAIYALIAIGYTMVYGILQLINFAHADVYMVGAFAAYYADRLFHLSAKPGLFPLIVALAVSMATCAVVGLIIERAAYRPLRHAPNLNLLITAIGVSLFLEYGGQVVFGADPKAFPSLIEDQALISFGLIRIGVFDLTILGTAVAMTLGLHVLVYHTGIGRAMRAVSQNSAVASLMGVDIDRVISFTFVTGSALAGVGSVLVGIKYPQIDPLMGLMIGLKAFVAAVFGGIGSLPGAVVGGLIMGVLEEFVVGYGGSSYRDALAFGVLILILVIRPTGLFGKSSMEKV